MSKLAQLSLVFCLSYFAIGCQVADKSEPTTPASASALSIPQESHSSPTPSAIAQSTALPSTAPSEQGNSEIQLGERFALKQNESIQFQNFSLSFSEVLSDSRCPVDAQCIWAGEVQVRLSVTENTQTVALDFTLPGQEIKSLNEKYQLQLLSVARPATEIELHLLKAQ